MFIQKLQNGANGPENILALFYAVAFLIIVTPVVAAADENYDVDDYQQQARISWDWDHFRWGCEDSPPVLTPPLVAHQQCWVNDLMVEGVEPDPSGSGTRPVDKKFRVYASTDLQFDESDAAIVPNPDVEHVFLGIHGSQHPLKFKYGATKVDNVLDGTAAPDGTVLETNVAFGTDTFRLNGPPPADWAATADDANKNKLKQGDIIEVEVNPPGNGNKRYFYYKITGITNTPPIPGGGGNPLSNGDVIQVQYMSDRKDGMPQPTLETIPRNFINLPAVQGTTDQPTFTAADTLTTRILTGSFNDTNAKGQYNAYLDVVMNKMGAGLGDATTTGSGFPYAVATVHFAGDNNEGDYYPNDLLPDHYKSCVDPTKNHTSVSEDCVKWTGEWRRGDNPLFCPISECDIYGATNDYGNREETSIDIMDRVLKKLTNKALFPNLKSVLMIGHSAGAQFVNRYVTLGKGIESLDTNATIRYVSESPGTMMYPTAKRIFHNNHPHNYNDRIINPYTLLTKVDPWRVLTDADDYFTNNDDDTDPTYYNEYSFRGDARRIGMCLDAENPSTGDAVCVAPYDNGGDEDDGDEKYGDLEKVIHKRLKNRDYVLYVGGEEVCETMSTIWSQGDNHMYRALAYYLHANDFFGEDTIGVGDPKDDVYSHNTSFVYAPYVGHSSDALVSHYIGDHNMLEPSREFDCSPGSMDSSLEICNDSKVDVKTRFWSDITISDREYTIPKAIVNEGGKVILKPDAAGNPVVIDLDPTGKQEVFTIAVTKQPSHRLEVITAAGKQDFENTSIHCTGTDLTTVVDPMIATGPYWEAGVYYPAGTAVVHVPSNLVYIAQMTHDSSVSNPPPTVPYWALGKTPGGNWVSWVQYLVGDIVVHDGEEYICLQDHQADPEFAPHRSSDYWCKIVDGPTDGTWGTCVRYFEQDAVKHLDINYECLEEHVSYPGLEPVDSPQLWSKIGPDAWDEWIDYEQGDLVEYQGVTYICVTSHRSQPDWTPLDVPTLWNVVVDGGSPWTAWVQYTKDEIVPYEGQNYRCKISHVSQPTWAPPMVESLWEPVP